MVLSGGPRLCQPPATQAVLAARARRGNAPKWLHLHLKLPPGPTTCHRFTCSNRRPAPTTNTCMPDSKRHSCPLRQPTPTAAPHEVTAVSREHFIYLNRIFHKLRQGSSMQLAMPHFACLSLALYVLHFTHSTHVLYILYIHPGAARWCSTMSAK